MIPEEEKEVLRGLVRSWLSFGDFPLLPRAKVMLRDDLGTKWTMEHEDFLFDFITEAIREV